MSGIFNASIFNNAVFNTSAATTPVPVVIAVGGGGSDWTWQDEVEAKFRKRHLKGLIAKAKRKLVQLKEQERKIEKTIQVETRQGHSIDGILYRHIQIVEQIEVKQAEIRRFTDEFSTLLKYISPAIRVLEDEDDIEVILLQ